jgi:hypothetical protein
MSERLCKTCQINHPIDDFETYKINGEVREVSNGMQKG